MKKFSFVEYSVTGLNLNRFINSLAKNGVTLYKIKKISPKTMIVSIKEQDDEKFFVFLNKLCYNVKRIRTYGVLRPVDYLIKNLGVVLGVIIFSVVAFIGNGFIFGIEYYGSGAQYQSVAEKVLKESGVTPFSYIKSTEGVAQKILTETDKFSFVSIKKRGGKILVNLVESNNGNRVLDTGVENLVSTVDGVIESALVYRGTLLKQVGESVNVGEVIVGGYNVVKEEIIPTFVLARVTLTVTEVISGFSEIDFNEEYFGLLTIESLDKKIIEWSAEKEKVEGGFIYRTTIKYQVVIIGG